MKISHQPQNIWVQLDLYFKKKLTNKIKRNGLKRDDFHILILFNKFLIGLIKGHTL